jgi:N-acetylmuramoyl-L-alanine amidase
MYVRGASGYLDEVDEARRVAEKVADYLRTVGVDVKVFHDNTSQTQNENLNTIVNYHNSQTRDADISIHFNAYSDTAEPMGCEVLYTTQEELAANVSLNIADAGDFIDRGPKHRPDLYFLSKTEMPAILIETCFVDSLADSELYRANFDEICRAIAECIGDRQIGGIEPEPEPVPTPEPEPPPLTEKNWVEINGSAEGNVAVIVNGQLVRGPLVPLGNVVDIQIAMHGDVMVRLNGQDFHNEPSIPPNQTAITATVFGGVDDPNCSAYDESMMLNDNDLYVALPDRFEGERPMVRVHNRATGESATAEIWDVGPWNIDNPYWETGERPQAEICYLQQTELPDGPNAGNVPSNPAGIDLSPALARALGIEGKGQVDWQFVN